MECYLWPKTNLLDFGTDPDPGRIDFSISSSWRDRAFQTLDRIPINLWMNELLGAYKMMAGVCVSVRPSICLSVTCLEPNWKTERPRNPKTGKMEGHQTGSPCTYFEFNRSKATVSQSVKALLLILAVYAYIGRILEQPRSTATPLL